jgi:REP element-mobilizing transposase RayT
MPSRLRRFNDPGHIHYLTISCFRRLQFFRHDNVKLAFIEAMRRVREKLGVRWIGYVIMPEHVHVLVLPLARGSEDAIPISTVLHDLKGYSGRWCKDALRDVWRECSTLGTTPLDHWARGEAACFRQDRRPTQSPTPGGGGAPGRQSSDLEQAVTSNQHVAALMKARNVGKPFWKPRGYDFNIVGEKKIPEKLDYLHRNPLRRGLVERPEDWRWSSYRYYECGDSSPIAMDDDWTM